MGVATCVCCCRRRGRAGTSNRWRDSRCGCGHSARRCGCSRRTKNSRSGWPAADLARRAAELIAAEFDTVAAAAEGCDALVATGMFPGAVGAVGDRETGHPLRVRELPADHPAAAAPPAAAAAGPAAPTGGDRQPGAVDLDTQSMTALFGAALNTGRRSACHR
jgi:hypothetical protein